MTVTKEEVEGIVAHHMATAVAQIGKDLEAKYATKDEVVQRIKEFAQGIGEMATGWGKKFCEDLKEGKDLPDDHPLRLVVQIVDDILTLQLQVMELGLLMILSNEKGMVGRDINKTMRLVQMTQKLMERQRERVFGEMEKHMARNPESPFVPILQEIRELTEPGG